MLRWRCDSPVRILPVDHRPDPMNQVKVDVIKSELAARLTACSLNIIIVGVPQFCGNIELLTGNTGSHYFGKSFSDLLLISVDVGSVNVTISVFKDRLFDHLLWVVSHQEGSKTNDRLSSSIVQLDARTGLRLDFCLYHL